MSDILERRIPEAKPIRHAGPEILDQNIRCGDQPQEDVAALGMLEIEGDRPLASILSQEGCTHVGPIEVRVSTELARKITGARHLDLDHVGAKLGKLITAEGPGKHIGQVQNAHAGKKSTHRSSHLPPSPVPRKTIPSGGESIDGGSLLRCENRDAPAAGAILGGCRKIDPAGFAVHRERARSRARSAPFERAAGS